MNKEIKEQWLAALKSGKYTHGVGYLCRNGKHCCLGVLAEILLIKKETSIGLSGLEIVSYNGSSNYLPRALSPLSVEQEVKLSNLNDDSLSYVPAINYIEKNL